MTKKIYLLGFFLVASLFLQLYLTKQFYSVQYGVGLGESICNINEFLNCDSVALSKYSKIFGVPNAVLGTFLNLILLIGLLGYAFNSGSQNKEEESSWLNFYFTLAVVSMGTSIVLAIISVIAIKKLCIFCAALYVLSILSVIFTKLLLPEARLSLAPFTQNKTFLILVAGIPVLGLFTHMIIKNEYSPKKMEKEIQAAIGQWEGAKELISEDDMAVAALFVENKGAKYKIVEFADFLCPHCATAHKSLSSFSKAYKDVEFHFYPYPLDANCNAVMDKRYSGPGYTCTLAKGVYCAGKIAGKAKEMHHEIFENQRSYAETAQRKNNSGLIKRMAEHLEISENDLQNCVASEEAQNRLLESSKLGQKARVQGTPTVFFNGKKLSGGANFLVLKKAFESL